MSLFNKLMDVNLSKSKADIACLYEEGEVIDDTEHSVFEYEQASRAIALWRRQ